MGREALPKGRDRWGGPPGGPGRVGRPSRKAGRVQESSLWIGSPSWWVRSPSRWLYWLVGSGQEALLVGRRWSGSPPGGPLDPSWRARRASPPSLALREGLPTCPSPTGELPDPLRPSESASRPLPTLREGLPIPPSPPEGTTVQSWPTGRAYDPHRPHWEGLLTSTGSLEGLLTSTGPLRGPPNPSWLTRRAS